MRKKQPDSHICHDCGAKPGELHEDGCDVERCPECGGQLISCCCEAWDEWGEDGPPKERRQKWTGVWPGEVECEEFGWFAKMNPNGPGWVPCPKEDPEAIHDMNRLHTEAFWDKRLGRFVRHNPKEVSLN
jgi:hypothetical protein